DLIAAIDRQLGEVLDEPRVEGQVVLDFADGRSRAWLHEAGVVEREEAGEDGLHLDLRWTARQKGAFEAFTGTATEADEDDEPEEPRSGGWHPAD
ncbi:hypothetical protein MGSAQ_002701, partial [marine sediment metagenome]